MTWSQLVEEYETSYIGERILSEVEVACRDVSRNYPPSVYASVERWDEDAINDLVQDVIVERLLGEAQIDYVFDAALSLEDFRRLLQHQVRRTLARTRKRTVIDNLLDRAMRILAAPPFRPAGTRGRLNAYTLDKRQHKETREPTATEISIAASSVRGVPRLRPESGDRAPSVYTTQSLQLLIVRAAEVLPTSVTRRDLSKILELLLTDWIPTVLRPDEQGIGDVSRELGPESAALMGTSTESFLARLSTDEIRIIVSTLNGEQYQSIAKAVGVSRPTLMERRRLLNQKLTEFLEDFDERDRIAAMDALYLAALPLVDEG